MSGGGGNTVSRTELDPTMQPYVSYGLSEAQRLYQTPDMPSYYPGQTYVGPSQQTQSALQAAQARASQGNPLVPAAQQTALGTVQGQYLGGNPFFQGAFQGAATAAQQQYFDAMNQVSSNASQAGRYGSGAMGQLQDRATGQFATALTNTAGNLAYQNYDAERARQQAMVGAAPQLAQADYADINQLLQTGQAAEGYQEAAMADAVNRFNFAQQAPYNKLQSFLSSAYGAPTGMQTTTPVYRNVLGNIAGGAMTGYALGGGTTGAAIGAGLGLLG
jgi:hypothetical protein